MKKTVFETTINAFKQKIIDKEWAPGDRLPTLQQLANHVSVSVTTVREALRTLESQGLISIEHGRGMYVRNDPLLLEDPTMKLEELGHISLVTVLEARLLIEPELAALCAQYASKSQVKRLHELTTQLDQEMKEGGSYLDTDLAFHQVIVEGAKNPVLGRMMEAIMPLLKDGRKQTNTMPHMRTKASHYHALIAIAIEEQQCEKAKTLMQAHITDMLEALKK
ncbi:hypothetical protein ASG89_17575 [Paenibacillus sp. Soil766]|uniref:FadR/GntR family transcriptional regulator n=1 Tax=Paenibacillus sp. Soil766 TaxID=1736404 RepID=UPI00070EDD96|nr:FCD domain-containing protein [Paenibacillus sp. Soil766]KRF07155.1 hypothetical protein ASG89_17575 [Paenibacillus sp. Soil766]